MNSTKDLITELGGCQSLAAKTGISIQNAWSWSCGRRAPSKSARLLLEILSVLGDDAEAVLTKVQEKFNS